MNIALGNQKPAALLEVEKIMWRGLFAMASGEDPNKILRDVANQISLEKLNLLPMPERQWFKLSVLPMATRQEPLPTSPLLAPSLSSPSNDMHQSTVLPTPTRQECIPTPPLSSPPNDVDQQTGDEGTPTEHESSFQDTSMVNPRASEQGQKDEGHSSSNSDIDMNGPSPSPVVGPTVASAPPCPSASRQSARLRETEKNPPPPMSVAFKLPPRKTILPAKNKSRKRKRTSTVSEGEEEDGRLSVGFDREYPIDVDELMELFPIKQEDVVSQYYLCSF